MLLHNMSKNGNVGNRKKKQKEMWRELSKGISRHKGQATGERLSDWVRLIKQ